MSSLILNGRSYKFEWLSDSLAPLDQTPHQTPLTAYERQTLCFCRRWLCGEDIFFLRTSGSTGQPKLIGLNRAQMIASAHLTGEALGLRRGDEALVCLPTNYIAGLMMLVRGFELGLSLIVITPRRNPLAGFSDDIAIAFTSLTSLQLQEILSATPEKRVVLNRMRAVLVGGSPIPEAVLKQIETLEVPVFHSYGMTETVSHVALKRLNGPSASEYFIPLKGVKTGLSSQGCLTISSVLTENQTLVTNDLVDLRTDGSFRWLGRIDNVINSGGIKIQAESVELVLARLFQTFSNGALSARRFFVGPLDHPEFGQAVVAVIEGQPLSQEMVAEIRVQLLKSKLLTDYEIPRYYCFLPRLVETATGKINRRASLLALSPSFYRLAMTTI